MELRLPLIAESSELLDDAYANQCARSASVCLSANQIKVNPTKISSNTGDKIEVYWIKPNAAMLRTYQNRNDRTKDGAFGVAVLYMLEKYNVIFARSDKATGHGVDIYFSEKTANTFFYQEKCCVEVSGIHTETKTNSVNRRIKDKLERLGKSKPTNLPARIVVVEFSKPHLEYVEV